MKDKLNEDDDYYYNGDGYIVLTANYLLERGYCCGNGCLHCPYDYKMVPEPKRSKFRAARQPAGNQDAQN